jgi:hypothetical protein
MWRLTVALNSLIVFLSWLAGFVALSPAFNRFVQYAPPGERLPLPILTDFMLSVRMTSLAFPVAWVLGSIFPLMWANRRDQIRRTEIVALHTSLSILAGLLLFLVFVTAGILPYLQISALID